MKQLEVLHLTCDLFSQIHLCQYQQHNMWKSSSFFLLMFQLQQQFHLCRRDVGKHMIPRAQNS